ncbi:MULTISPECIES: amino acid adenylation domain-containing protein [Pseudomonas]|uniref:amino acid adenylation domain-containing protein n=1 Tax=Pseudomonas TaxID=286 RepID=UPI000CD4F523|nr:MULTISPECIES: amino acid adenylation domain-containing protein [Pseudomonas]RBH52376.1 amino acid adenylation domain-containing protein [Pseudomonas sp. MWU13-2860]
MRRLTLLLVGSSQALDELLRELEQHGHSIQRLSHAQAIEAQPPGAADLLIEDGSLVLHTSWRRDLGACIHLALRLEQGPVAPQGLPALSLLCRLVEEDGSRLIQRLGVDQDGSGNGQALRLAAVQALVERVALQVSRYSRDADYFAEAATLPSASEHPEQDLRRLETLAFEHRLNQTARPELLALAQVSVIEHIESSLLRFAERPALTLDGVSLTYRELHDLSRTIQQSLLARLDALGPFTEPPVIGLCQHKSPALYASILAILGAGAVYLPLDPGHPLQRQLFVLKDAGASLLLHDGQSSLAEQLPALDVRGLAQKPTDQPLVRQARAPQAPCLALYTSGTTGQPKGVLLSQHNLSHFTAWYADYVQLSETSRVLQFSTLSFDSSLIDIFPTLVSGAALVVPTEDQRRDPLQLLALIRGQRLSHAFLPPALLSILPLDTPLGLSHVMTGGDVCEPDVIEKLSTQCHFYNLYGPTETTVLVTARRFQPGSGNRSLGQAIANSQVLILDEQRQPVAEQTVGELYIAGPGVGLGYLNNPDKTADSYLQLALGQGESLRAYRTGDMAKWTGEGIELCGRRDNQVKIRGFRVEPEEIEQCLRDSRLYRQIAVVIDPRRRVLAFMSQPQSAGGQDALRQHAERYLPDYMQPTVYTELASLPSASNGKIDRGALLKLPVETPENSRRRLPATADESRLLELWAELLELPVEDISTDESFFNLGGHSILLSKMLLGIREQYGRGISINRFIEEPTLCRLAMLVGGAATSQALSEQILIDVERELGLNVLPADRTGDVNKVVVTGANSFVGVHLVEALLAGGAVEVACLVRDSAAEPAAERFARALRENRLEHLDLSRVRVHAADLTRPLLGLAPAVYERIDREFGALVHNAANVNHVLDYESLAPDNVDPLFECLRLCEGRSKKIFNFISTLSASSSTDAEGRVLEQPAAQTPPIYIRNGYNLSKWVGERILQRAREQGAWVNLYRPGNISFNSRTGVSQPHKNRLMLMLKGSLQLGQVPALELNFDLMPVDFLARFIAVHGRRTSAHGVFNLHNPQPLSWADYMASFREAGHDFQLVSVADWQRQLHRVDSNNALFEVLGFYLNGFEEDIGDISAIGHAHAAAAVREMGEQYPAKTPALLRKGCDYLKQIQFI